MAILKLILFLAVLWLTMKFVIRFFIIYKNFKKFFTFSSNIHNSNQKTEQNTKNNQSMVKCKTCNLYIPKNESYQKNDDFYCCKEHVK